MSSRPTWVTSEILFQKTRALDTAQWWSSCLEWARPWTWSPVLNFPHPSPPKDNFHFTNKEWEAWSCLVAHPKARSQEGAGLGFKLKILTEVHIQSKSGSYIFCELYCGICKAGMHLLNRISIHRSFIYAWLQFLKATFPNYESKGLNLNICWVSHVVTASL